MDQSGEGPHIKIGTQLGNPPKMKIGSTDHLCYLGLHSERRVQMEPQGANPILNREGHPPKGEGVSQGPDCGSAHP